MHRNDIDNRIKAINRHQVSLGCHSNSHNKFFVLLLIYNFDFDAAALASGN